MRPDTCLICGYPVALHFVRGRTISCTEVAVQVTGTYLKFPSCAEALHALPRDMGDGTYRIPDEDERD